MSLWGRVVIAGLAALAFAGVASGMTERHEAVRPTRGVLIGGVSLAEVQLGDSPRAVELAWGTNHMSCGNCQLRTWLFIYPNRPAGAAVAFERGHAVAVFTIGQPYGWRTAGGGWGGARVAGGPPPAGGDRPGRPGDQPPSAPARRRVPASSAPAPSAI